MPKTIARTTDVEPGHVRAFEIREQGAAAVGRSRIPLLKAIGVGRSSETRITLANVAGTFFAIDDTCTHKGCSLGDGKLDAPGAVPVRCAASALSISGVTSRVDASGPNPVLFVDGEAVNDGAKPAQLPPLEIRVTGNDRRITRYTLGTSGRFAGARRKIRLCQPARRA